MAHNPRSLAITDAYRARISGIVALVERQTRQRWPAIENFDAGSDPWLAATTATVTEAQRQSVRATQGYLAAFLTSELGRRTQPPPLDSRSYLGISRNGRPLSETLKSPLIGVRVALADGKTPDEALRFGLDRALRAVDLDTKQAARRSLQDAMKADERIDGWRRAVSGTCDACLGLAQESTLPPGTPLEIHPNCECVAEPNVSNLPNSFPRPTGDQIFAGMSVAEQDQQFGPEKAKLLRDGVVTLASLVDRSPMATGPDFITAKPLDQLPGANGTKRDV